jgi:hypothetical protein
MTHPTQGEIPLDDDTSKNPPMLDDETRRRGLTGIERARKTLNDPKPYVPEGGHCGLWEDAVQGQNYYVRGTHGQVYANYASAPRGVNTPMKQGAAPPPPGATHKRPLEEVTPTLSKRSYLDKPEA